MAAPRQVLSVLFLIFCNVYAQNPTVTIEEGTLEGSQRVDRKGDTFFAFRSIPYAKPPIGNLRFQDPQQVDPWTGTYSATADLPSCYQTDFFGAHSGVEDCLYLNVFTPELNVQESDLKPVLFFIHGGGFTSGTGSEILYGPEFLIPEDVVLVVTNYRLGIFGFFSLSDSDNASSGNAALKDIVMALKWVQRNIREFSGDPNSVTVFGESSGATAAHLLVLSPLATGLFHKVIIQSDTAFNHTTRIENGKELARVLEIQTDDVTTMLASLRTLTAREVLEASASPYVAVGIFIESESDTAFLSSVPEDITTTGNYNKDITLLFGYNDAEGIAVDQLRLYIYQQHVLVTDFTEMIPPAFGLGLTAPEVVELAALIKEHYYGDAEPSTDDMVPFIRMFTETNYAFPVVRAINEHLKTSSKPIYLYRFSADTGMNTYKNRHPVTAMYSGASHADELAYLFKTVGSPQIVADSVEDVAVDRVVKIWANFARSGDPSTDGTWSAVTETTLNYVDIGTDANVAGVDPDAEGIQFWMEMYEKYFPTSSSNTIKSMFLLVLFFATISLW